MRILRDFEWFLANGTVRKRNPDRDRAESLVKEAESKRLFMERVIRESKENIYPNFVIEGGWRGNIQTKCWNS